MIFYVTTLRDLILEIMKNENCYMKLKYDINNKKLKYNITKLSSNLHRRKIDVYVGAKYALLRADTLRMR